MAMRPAVYEELGITRPERCESAEPTNQRIEKQDLEIALAGLPLRPECNIARGFGSETWLVRTTAQFCSIEPAHALVAKLTTCAAEDSAEFFSLLATTNIPTIQAPIYWRRLPNNRLLIISPHLPSGSLREYMRKTRVTNEQVRRIVRQLTTALSYMNTMNPDRVLVHGDIKPENILVKSVDPLDILLADFDHSLWVPNESTHAHDGMLSLRYAAPEGLVAGRWSSNSDMWSLGMLVLELLLGRHPFEGVSDESVRLELTTWEMPEDSLDDDVWRALLLGLLERRYATRWRIADVELWLQGDRATIAKGLGLSRGREPSANSPFEINGRDVYSARTLAHALIDDWHSGIAVLRSHGFEAWLRDALNSPELVLRRQGLLENTSLTDDDRLIRFAYFAHQKLDPFWHDIRLSAAALHALASRALGGDAGAYQHLVALRDAAIVESYSSVGIDGPRALIGGWRDGWQRYKSAWDLLLAAGAPDARPADEAAFPALVRLWLSPEERSALVQRVEEQCSALRFLLRRNWYFALGHDLLTLPIEHQWILDGLDRSSLVETLIYSRGHQDFTQQQFRQPPRVTDEQLMNAVLLSHTTDRLTRNLALEHRSREEITLHGPQQHEQRLMPDAWDSFWTRITAPIGLRIRNLAQPLLQWWRRRRRGGNPLEESGGATSSANDAAVTISAIRVNLTLPGKTSDSIGQAALIRWNLPANARPAIHIGHLGLFGRRITRQRIVRLPLRLEGAPAPSALARVVGRANTVGLPNRGQIAVVFFQPSIVWLQYRMPRRRGTLRSQVLRLGARFIRLHYAEAALDLVKARLDEVDSRLLTIVLPASAWEGVPPIDNVSFPPNAWQGIPPIDEVDFQRNVWKGVPAIDEVAFQNLRSELQLPREAYRMLLRQTMHQRTRPHLEMSIARLLNRQHEVIRGKL